MKRSTVYKELKAAVKSGSAGKVCTLLSRENIDDIHGCFCEELSAKHPAACVSCFCVELPAEDTAACVSCKALLRPPLKKLDADMIKVLLYHGAYPPVELCTSGHRYGKDKPLTPLKLAVESGDVEAVRKLLAAGADVNLLQSQICAMKTDELDECTACDTPLMAAVRRRDVTMMRALIAYGADVSQAIRSIVPGQSCKTSLKLAAETRDERVITELVTSGADVNQSLGPRGTVLHHYCDNNELMKLLVRLGADPNARDGQEYSMFLRVLYRGHIYATYDLDSVLQSLRLLLPTTRNLDYYFQSRYAFSWLEKECAMLLLQHGARIDYLSLGLNFKSMIAVSRNSTQQSEEFIEFLRAADTNFRGMRPRIYSLYRENWDAFSLDVLTEKLSQPLTLQTSCVISVRRRLRSIRDFGMWASIDALPLPTIIRNRLKLIVW